MKIIFAVFVSLSICFTTIAFADNTQTGKTTSNKKSHSCGCSKYKHKS